MHKEELKLESNRIIEMLTHQTIIVVYENEFWKEYILNSVCETGRAVLIDSNTFMIRGTKYTVRFITIHNAATAIKPKTRDIFYEPLDECRLAAYKLLGNYLGYNPPYPLEFDPSDKYSEDSNIEIDGFLKEYSMEVIK